MFGTCDLSIINSQIGECGVTLLGPGGEDGVRKTRLKGPIESISDM